MPRTRGSRRSTWMTATRTRSRAITGSVSSTSALSPSKPNAGVERIVAEPRGERDLERLAEVVDVADGGEVAAARTVHEREVAARAGRARSRVDPRAGEASSRGARRRRSWRSRSSAVPSDRLQLASGLALPRRRRSTRPPSRRCRRRACRASTGSPPTLSFVACPAVTASPSCTSRSWSGCRRCPRRAAVGHRLAVDARLQQHAAARAP